ncbi:MAG: DUF2617 family protein [Actinomycetota bacterium]|nr:DUF2617 family protein [Actinomycetota bacterium]
MQATLTAPYADVRAADLVLELDVAEAPALETLELALGAFRLELRLLGHSHQVRVTAPGFALSETVSCRSGGGDDAVLPAARAVRRDGRAYVFSADVLGLEGFGAAALVADVAADPRGLVGVFRGRDHAFTALRGAAVEHPGASGVRWETWHAYPQTGELVRTTGEVLDA